MTRLAQVRLLLQEKPNMSNAEAASRLGVSEAAVRNPLAAARSELKLDIRKHSGTGSIDASPAQALPGGAAARQEVTSEYGTDTAVIGSLHVSIKSLDDLLKAANVDLAVWEVEKHVINKWEVVMREPATTVGGAGDKAVLSVGKNGEKSTLWTRGSSVPLHEPMWQVKVWLRRKTPRETSLASLLSRIESAAPILPPIKFPKRRQSEPKLSLEVSIMDPHIGMRCFKGESDDEQTLESAGGLILQAMDDLIKKGQIAAGREWFDEAFMPFGNDFVHADNIDGTTTAGTGQPEALAYHDVYIYAESIAIAMVERLRKVARKVYVYEIPGNHSCLTDFTLARLLKAYFRHEKEVVVDASPDPYKFHRFGVNLIGFEHGHSVSAIRYAGLMANERPGDLAGAPYREWHLGDQHRKGSSKPSSFEEQGVSIEYLPGLTAANGWHRKKAFNHQKRGAMGFLWDHDAGPLYRFGFNILKYQQKVA